MDEGSSARAAQYITEQGHDKAYALKGGWKAWKNAKYPTSKK
ncbi:rhodanese-like domain-containing protein [Thermodesulfobacteriota bacterium]